MKTPDIALLILGIFLSIVLGGIALILLWYFVTFVIMLASNVHWIAIPIGIIALGYVTLTILAMHIK